MSKENSKALEVRGNKPALRNKTSQVSAIQRAEAGAADYVAHVSPGQVMLLATAAGKKARHGRRNALLIRFIFDGCLRVTEAINVRPVDIVESPEGYAVRILASHSKNKKAGISAISPRMAADLQSYCFKEKLENTDLIFPISRSQAFRIVTDAFDKAGIHRPTKEHDHVGGVHVLRHSGAIERLRITGNPRATQDQLRHQSALMTLRYLKTLSADESLKVQQSVELW